MKLIIAGGRDYRMTSEDIASLDKIHESRKVTEVVSGCASGADADGEEWARSRGIPISKFPANWGEHGRAAGPIRNQKMAEYAHALAVFDGGRGTADMLSRAKACGLRIYDFRSNVRRSSVAAVRSKGRGAKPARYRTHQPSSIERP